MADAQISTTAAVLEHLTGPSRGSFSWVTGEEVGLWLLPNGALRCASDGTHVDAATRVARITRAGSGYEISADSAPIWVNRHLIDQAPLHHGDMIEFGDKGPISRLRVFDERHRPTLSMGDILGDAISYMKTSRRPVPSRTVRAATDVMRRSVLETTVWFRLMVVAALVLLGIAVFAQYQTDRRLRAAIESGALQIDSVASALAEARDDAIRPGDLAALRADLRRQVTDTTERLDTLEALSDAGTQIIREARPAVAFLQGAYGLRHRESGLMLRMVVDEGGVPRNLPNGQPYLSLEGTGPVAEVQFNGTGFALRGEGVIITNRHVAQPWDLSPGAAMGLGAMEPVMIRFLAYFPDRVAPLNVSVLRVSPDADLTLLTAQGDLPEGLDLAQSLPEPGEEVIVMGYPTGLMSLLAQSGPAFVEALEEAGETSFWSVAKRLSDAGLISPLSSRGIVAQATETTVVYDAETTHGGSGGPVLNRAREVVAVNTAILPEFGGSNLGVPTAKIRDLLALP
ncbi:trypsin-like peptidase domain-containing protein [Phaeobacter marinintestinus]|uniref:trypsin-like peptidase domain-containing protein n=1 Tax=Falsiphaeobacter marinintestinus TaxID=1492905 RepID=UPI0011B79E16|nr:trypsin-like peptidase domain-containing protein [Phaeobacter marinintestinus]